MAYIPRSSFTSGAAAGAIPAQVKKRRTIRIFGVLSMIMIIGSLASVVVTFLYKEYAVNQLEASKAALQKESDVDNEKYIEEIRVYDKKLRVAEYLLDTHIAPSHIFEKLEGSAKETVQFESLEFSYDPGFEAALEVDGVTKEFASLALQKIQFSEDALFSEFVLHDVSLITEEERNEASGEVSRPDSIGKVGFTVTGLFDKDWLMYTGAQSTEALPSVETQPDMSENTVEAAESLPEGTGTTTNNVDTP